jgi:branched-chain amino acid transport system permease protein
VLEVKLSLKTLLPFTATVFIFLIAILASCILSGYYLTLVAMAAIWACLAWSWCILARAGLFSIGSQLLMGIGAYSLCLAYGAIRVDPFLLLPIAGVIGAMVSVVFWPAILRRMSFAYFAIYSLVASLVCEYYFKQMYPYGFYAGLRVDRGSLFIISMVLSAATLTFIHLFMKSKTFLKLTSIGQNQVAAEACGISLLKYRALSLFVSGFISGLMGGLLMIYINNFNAEFFLSTSAVINMQIACLLGGLETFWGPIIGGTLLSVISLKLGELFVGVSQALLGMLLVVLIIWQPRGIGELLTRLISKKGK